MAPRTDPASGSTGDADAAAPTMLEQLGGVSGLIYSTLPILVFVPVNAVYGLNTAIASAIAVAVAIFVLRLVRREPVMPAVSGVIGVALCAFIAHRTGDAKGYFLFGIWASLAYAAVLVLSIVVRWPLIGVAWNAINGTGNAWRHHRRTRLAYDIATAFWALVFGIRYLAQSHLYDEGATGWLATARIGMGWLLTALAVVVTVVLVRWAGREEELTPDAQKPDAQTPGTQTPVPPPSRSSVKRRQVNRARRSDPGS